MERARMNAAGQLVGCSVCIARGSPDANRPRCPPRRALHPFGCRSWLIAIVLTLVRGVLRLPFPLQAHVQGLVAIHYVRSAKAAQAPRRCASWLHRGPGGSGRATCRSPSFGGPSSCTCGCCWCSFLCDERRQPMWNECACHAGWRTSCGTAVDRPAVAAGGHLARHGGAAVGRVASSSRLGRRASSISLVP